MVIGITGTNVPPSGSHSPGPMGCPLGLPGPHDEPSGQEVITRRPGHRTPVARSRHDHLISATGRRPAMAITRTEHPDHPVRRGAERHPAYHGHRAERRLSARSSTAVDDAALQDGWLGSQVTRRSRETTLFSTIRTSARATRFWGANGGANGDRCHATPSDSRRQ